MMLQLNLQNETLLLVLLACHERGTGCVLKDLPHALVGLGRALEILQGTNLLADFFGLDISG